MYSPTLKNRHYFLIALLMPVVPLIQGLLIPNTQELTILIKPLSQIVSHIPQLLDIFASKSTEGISITSQHLNMTGGVLGLLMCYFHPPLTHSTYFIYANSVFQAVSIYVCQILYKNNTKLKSPHSSTDRLMVV